MEYQIVIDDIIGTWGYTAAYVRSCLSKCKGKHVDLCLCSRGGEVDHALSIRQQLMEHGDVTVHIQGLAASAATIIATGAKEVRMARSAFYMVHKCLTPVDVSDWMNADDLQKLIDELIATKGVNDKIDAVIAQVYADKTGHSQEELQDFLTGDRWLTAEEALEMGFVDRVCDYNGDVAVDYNGDLSRRFEAVGLPINGLPFEKIKNLKNKIDVNKYSFSHVEAILDLSTLNPDKDGDVTVTAEQMHTVNAHIAELESKAEESLEATAKAESARAEADEQLSTAKAEIKALKERIDAMNQAPGDETTELNDADSSTVDATFTAAECYNAFKHLF